MRTKKAKKKQVELDSSPFSLWWKEPLQTPVTVLGLDPALQTFAWTVLHIEAKDTYKVIGSGKLKSANILDGHVTQENLKAVVYDLNEMIKDFKITYGATERIMYRGHGPTLRCIEQMNLLIGSLMLSSVIPFKLISASVWKKYMLPLEGDYQWTNADYFPDLKTDHQRDAGCIALYSFYKMHEEGRILIPKLRVSPKEI